MNKTQQEVEELLRTIKTLRAPDGCPWDRKQTTASLKKYLREEVDELIEAIELNDRENTCEEIGDVLYVLAMMAEIHNEKGDFSFFDSVSSIKEKLIRRHPHVFQDSTVSSEEELREQWEKIKKEEKKRNI